MVSGESLILNPGLLIDKLWNEKKSTIPKYEKQSNMRFDGDGGDNVGDK